MPQGGSNWIDFADETATRLKPNPCSDFDPLTAGTQNDLVHLEGEKDFAVGDLDGDGDQDLVIVRKEEECVTSFAGSGRTNVILLNEDGFLVDRTPELAPFWQDVEGADPSRDVALFDADGDGLLDIAVANTFGVWPRLFRALPSASGGLRGYVEETSWLVGWKQTDFPRICGIAVGDVDADGDLDLFLSDYQGGPPTPPQLGHRLLFNESSPGTVRFEDSTYAPNGTPLHPPIPASLANPGFGSSVFAAPMNTDGFTDFVYVDVLTTGIGILRWNDDSLVQAFEAQTIGGTCGANLVYMALPVDFDGDGDLDLYGATDGCDFVLPNSTGSSGSVVQFDPKIDLTSIATIGGLGGNLAAADLDRDGDPDIAVCDIDATIDLHPPSCGICDGGLTLLRNTTPPPSGSGTGPIGFDDPNAALPPLAWNTLYTHDVAFLDLDRDGFLDMVTGLHVGVDAFGQPTPGLRVFRMQPFPSAGTYCTAAANSSGAPAAIGWSGSVSIASNSFALTVSNAIPGQSGYFFYGSQQDFAPFGDGIRCVGGSTFDLSPLQTVDAQGGATRQVDFTAPPADAGPGQITAGSTWNFQFWYRDPAGPSGSGFNYSDALSVTFGA